MPGEPSQEEPPREPQNPQPNWRMILIWVFAVVLLIVVIYLLVNFVTQSPERERTPEAEELTANPPRMVLNMPDVASG